MRRKSQPSGTDASLARAYALGILEGSQKKRIMKAIAGSAELCAVFQEMIKKLLQQDRGHVSDAERELVTSASTSSREAGSLPSPEACESSFHS